MYIKEKTIALINSNTMIQFFTLAGTATILPFFIHSQWVTGPIINAIFILALILLGLRSALLICVLPSLIALSSGLLPIILAPIVPFIVIGNAVLVLTIYYVTKVVKNKSEAVTIKQYYTGVILGSFLKFVFLFTSVYFVSQLFLKQELAQKVIQMMSWPQLYTALLGGGIALVILLLMKKIK